MQATTGLPLRLPVEDIDEDPEQPRREFDARLGWTFVPARTGHNTVGSRVIEYAFDPAGYRVRRVDEPVDPDRPTMVGADSDWPSFARWPLPIMAPSL